MTQAFGGQIFSGFRVAVMAAIATVALSASSGCTSTSTRQPTANAQPGPVNTGTFPNLNIPPQVAAKQFTPQETQDKTAELAAMRSQNGAPGATPATTDPVLLRKLAQTHAEEALKEIEE